MTKILIKTQVLKQMLKDQPEIEIELVKNASDQIAEAFKRKVDTNAMIGQMIASLEQQLSYRHSPLRDAAKQVIQKEVVDAVKIATLNVAGLMVKEAVNKAMEEHKIWIQNNLNGIIIDRINAALRAASEAAVKGAFK